MFFQKILRLLFITTLALSAGALQKAHADDAKLMLMLNSYHEDELWGNGMTEPIILEASRLDNVYCEVEYLNSSIITNIDEYNQICDNVFKNHAEKKPSYIVMVGNFAFTLRDRIKEEWGDVPMLLITRSEYYSPLSDYFVGQNEDFKFSSLHKISNLRNQYNFTAIVVHDYAKETIKLMFDLIPDMDNFIFMSDQTYVNRIAATDIYNYLAEMYPNVNYEWLKSTPENTEEFRSQLANRHPRTGYLLSSWVYEIQSTRDVNVLTTKDVKLVNGSVNPIFSLRQSYLTLGTLGGVFADNDLITSDILKIVDVMFAGKSMRTLPFYEPNEPIVKLNYNLLKKYGISEDACPEETIFTFKPQTYWEKYWQFYLIILAVTLAIFIILLKKNSNQRKLIGMLKRHSDFVHNLPVPYGKVCVTTDSQGNVLNVKYEIESPEFESMVAANKPDDAVGHLFPRQFLDKEFRLLLSAPSKDVKFTYHYDKTGKEFEFRVFLVESRYDAKKDISLYSVDIFAFDITERVNLTRKFRLMAQHLDMALSIAQIVPWQWESDGDKVVFTEDNKHVSQSSILLGGRDVLTMAEIEKLVHPDDREAFVETHKNMLSGKISEFAVELRMVPPADPDREEWVEMHAAVTERDQKGNPTMITGSAQVITARKQEEEAMEQAMLKASESDRMKSAFLANMSHEIRTPLNAIVGFSNLLIRAQEPKEKAEIAVVINKNNDLLLSLINDVLDLAKIEANTIDINYSICDINDVVDSIAHTMSMRVPKDVRLNVVHYSDKCIVSADSARLAQILINLLTNACKFTKKGSITVGHEIYEDEGMIYFFVKDTGMGLAPEDTKRVFQQFVKLNAFVQGTGLGLSICKSLVERMGGQIGVESPGLGKGCTFWFTIPYMPSENEMETIKLREKKEAARAEVEAIATKVLEEKPIDEPSDGHKPLALVVEDNDSNYWLMEQLLRHRFRVQHAWNGKEGVEMLKVFNPDLVVMDINMPVMDGYEAVAEMRKLSQTVPIIAVTAYAFVSDKERILASGFNAYVSKPVSEEALFVAIDEIMPSKK